MTEQRTFGKRLTPATGSAQPTEPTVAGAVAEFEAAWNDPRTTSVELPPVDVNRVLAEQYQVDPPTRMTRTQVWDMEVKKAWDPLTYIPHVVSEADRGRLSTYRTAAGTCRPRFRRRG